jgi:hypothetical protein
MLATSGIGPKRQFAAVKQYGRCRWNAGRSVGWADTASPDPEPTLPPHVARRFHASVCVLSENFGSETGC